MKAVDKIISRMKPVFAAVISLLLVFAFCLNAYAADNYVTLYGFAFEINSSGEAVIYDYDDREANVVIPETLLYRPVVEIADYAFYNDNVITGISFGKAVSLRKIGDNAFSKCNGLTSVKIPDDVELGFGAFQRCGGLKSADLGNTITVIPEQCFYCCPSLTDVYLPDTVTVIEPRAFDGCDDLVIYTPSYGFAYQYAVDNNIPVVPTDLECMLGDSNGDGFVTISDVTVIQRDIAGIETISGIARKASDVDRNRVIDIYDATAIQKHIALIDTGYEIGKIIK